MNEHQAQSGAPTAVISDRRTLKMFTGPPPAAEMGADPARPVAAAVDPNVAAVVHGLQTLERIAQPMAAAVGEVSKLVAKADAKPETQRGIKGLVGLLIVIAVGSGVVAGVGASVLAVWVHDQSTRGTVTRRLDDQDKAINGLVDAVNGVIDEGEAGEEWLCEALSDGFGKQITCRSNRGREKIRRGMPSKIQPQ